VSRMLLLILLCLFLIALARLVTEGEWELVASLIVGLLTARDDLEKIWKESEQSE